MSKTETKSAVLLKHHLKALKLPKMLAGAEKIACRCAADNADHLAILLQLAELELIERERKAAERRLKAARLPATMILDGFDFAARPIVNKPQVLELMKAEYLDRRENVLIVGPSGTGETHLATALGMAACTQGRKVRFFRVTELVTLLMEAKDERHVLRHTAAAGQARPPRPRRIRIRAREQGRCGVTLRRHRHGLRTQQPDRDDEHAL